MQQSGYQKIWKILLSIKDWFSKKDAMKKMKRDNPSLYKIYKEQGVTEVDNNMTQEIIDTLRSNI